MSTQVIIYSHGFGVKKDDRGLFTDIAHFLPDAEHIMFDYNEIDEVQNTLIACPLDTQAKLLTKQIAEARHKYPDADISIIAHSQGCVAVALANPSGIKECIFLAPPAQFLGLEKREIYAMRPSTVTDDDGTLRMPRRDGSTTIIRQDYWDSREGIVPIALYNKLAQHTSLTIITATDDEVLTNTDFSNLSHSVDLIKQKTDHDFTGDDARSLLCDTIDSIIEK